MDPSRKKKEPNQTERSCKCLPTFCLFLTLRKRSPHSCNESVAQADPDYSRQIIPLTALRDFFSPASPRARNGSSCMQRPVCALPDAYLLICWPTPASNPTFQKQPRKSRKRKTHPTTHQTMLLCVQMQKYSTSASCVLPSISAE